MNKFLIIALTLIGFSAFGQTGSLDGKAIHLRLTDSTLLVHPSGYGTLYYNAQSSKWEIYENGIRYDLKKFSTSPSVLLSALNDVNISSPIDADLFQYRSSDSKWHNFTLSGDITVTNLGVSAIGASKVLNSMLAGSITDAKILSATNWNTAYDRSPTSLGLTTTTLTLTKQDASTLTVSVPTWNQPTTGQAGSVANDLTVDNSSLQLNSGTTYNGGAARTISVKALGITNSLIANTTIDLTSKVTGLLPYANFSNGAGLSITGRSANSSGVQGDIVGTNNQVLRISGTTLGFGSLDLSQSATVGASILPVANGGTGASSIPYYLLASGGTASGANTFTANTLGWLNFVGTATATANSQNFLSIAPVITSRSTASDAIYGLSITGSITAASTTIAASPLYVGTSFKTSSGITTGSTGTQNGASAGNAVSNTVAGMTATTYTNVAPASTSGTGTGALFTVVVSSATLFTSITCTTSGSGYNQGETVTFNGNQFGSGSGSIVIAILSTINSVGTNTAAITVVTPVNDYAGITAPIFTAVSPVTGTKLFGISATGIGFSLIQNQGGVVLSDAQGTFLSTWTTSAAAIFGVRPISFSGAVTANSGFVCLTFTNNSTAAFTGASYGWFGSQGNGHANFTGSSLAIGIAGAARSYINATGGVTTGIPTTYTVSAGGSGYTAGNHTTTGGTGSGAIVSITVSGGAIATAVPVTSTSAGTGYVVGDVLAVALGTGGTVTVATVDQYGGVISVVQDIRALTDAKSNTSYPSYYSAPAYTFASSSASTWFGQYNPTYTSFGTGVKGNIAIIPTGTVGGIGNAIANISSTWDVNGSVTAAIVLSTGNLTLDATHSTVIITSGTGTYTLPAAAGATRRIYRIINQTGGARTISAYLDKAAASQTTIGANTSVFLQSDGTNWYQLN